MNFSKNVYIDKLDDIVNESSNTYKYRNTKMKPADITYSTYIDFDIKNDKDPKFKISEHLRISKYQPIFAKGYVPNWTVKVLYIKKVKNTVPYIL